MSFSSMDIDKVIDAMEALIEDMEHRRNPSGTWSGTENKQAARTELRNALIDLLRKIATPMELQ